MIKEKHPVLLLLVAAATAAAIAAAAATATATAAAPAEGEFSNCFYRLLLYLRSDDNITWV